MKTKHGLLLFGLTCVLGSATGSHAQDTSEKTSTNAAARLKSWEHHENLRDSSPFRELNWYSLGPRKQGGRIEAIACPPNDSTTMYVGVGSGGLWKTTNNGTTWQPIFQHEATNAIGELGVDMCPIAAT